MTCLRCGISITGRGRSGCCQKCASIANDRFARDQARLAALQLHWTKEKPTVPGWYWRRYNSSGVLIIEIVKIVSSGSKLVVRDFGGVIDFLLGEWAGPLVPPEEAR